MGRYDQFDRPSRRSPFRIILMIMLIALVVGVGYFLYPDNNNDPGIQKNATQREIPLKIPIKKSPAGNARGKQQISNNSPPGQQPSTLSSSPLQIRTDLPPLDQSDQAVQQDINLLAPKLGEWFASNQLLKKYLTIVNDFSQGQRPYKHFRFLRLKQAFKVKQDQKGLFIDPDSYSRYDTLVAAINQLDINDSLNYYQAYRPLLQQIFEGFGYPENHRLNDLFKKAIAQILQAPILENRIGLTKHATRYKFADKKLESLNPVHKQIIRMGPNNTRILQGKLRQFAQALVQLKSE